MPPGGIRRLIIPAKLAYGAKGSIADECVDGKGLGPRPSITDAVGEFQRFKNIYCEFFYACYSRVLCHWYHLSLTYFIRGCQGNPDRQYQPDLVMDVKLYGKRN